MGVTYEFVHGLGAREHAQRARSGRLALRIERVPLAAGQSERAPLRLRGGLARLLCAQDRRLGAHLSDKDPYAQLGS
jgi:hypothetical protein